MNYPVKMYEYHVWANQAIFNRLLELPGELYNRTITSVFPTVSEALIHIYTVDLGWMNILSGKDMGSALAEAYQLREELEEISLEDLNLRFIELADRYAAFLRQQPDLERMIRLDNPYAGHSGYPPVRDIAACREPRHLPSWKYCRHAAPARKLLRDDRLRFFLVPE